MCRWPPGRGRIVAAAWSQSFSPIKRQLNHDNRGSKERAHASGSVVARLSQFDPGDVGTGPDICSGNGRTYFHRRHRVLVAGCRRPVGGGRSVADVDWHRNLRSSYACTPGPSSGSRGASIAGRASGATGSGSLNQPSLARCFGRIVITFNASSCAPLVESERGGYHDYLGGGRPEDLDEEESGGSLIFLCLVLSFSHLHWRPPAPNDG